MADQSGRNIGNEDGFFRSVVLLARRSISESSSAEEITTAPNRRRWRLNSASVSSPLNSGHARRHPAYGNS